MARKTFEHRRSLVQSLGQIARAVGRDVQALAAPEARRLGPSEGHQWSTVHMDARSILDHHFFTTLKGRFHGRLLTVQRPLNIQPSQETTEQDGIVLGHEASGGVELYRSKVGPVPFDPRTAVGFGYCETSDFADLQGGVVFDISTGLLYDAVLTSDSMFETHAEDRRICPDKTSVPLADTSRVVVCGYYNSSVNERAELERAIVETEGRTPNNVGPLYDLAPGSGSSMLDLVYAAVLRRMDAVIDCRMYMPNRRDTDAFLSLKEVAAAIPICLGCGWTITDALNHPWTEFRVSGPISIVAAPPDIHKQIIATIRPLIEKWPPKPA